MMLLNEDGGINQSGNKKNLKGGVKFLSLKLCSNHIK